MTTSAPDQEATIADANTPTADRPQVPAGYGIPSIDQGTPRLGPRRTLACARRWSTGSRPPVRAACRGSARSTACGTTACCTSAGSPETRWARDLEANPRVSVHLDDGCDVVIIEGEAELLDTASSPELAVTLADISNAKYPAYGMTPEIVRRPGSVCDPSPAGIRLDELPEGRHAVPFRPLTRARGSAHSDAGRPSMSGTLRMTAGRFRNRYRLSNRTWVALVRFALADSSAAHRPFAHVIRRETLHRSVARHARFTAALVISTLVLATFAPAVSADDGLEVTTPYPAVAVAPGTKVSFDLTVSSTRAANVALPVERRARPAGRPASSAAASSSTAWP